MSTPKTFDEWYNLKTPELLRYHDKQGLTRVHLEHAFNAGVAAGLDKGPDPAFTVKRSDILGQVPEIGAPYFEVDTAPPKPLYLDRDHTMSHVGVDLAQPGGDKTVETKVDHLGNVIAADAIPLTNGIGGETIGYVGPDGKGFIYKDKVPAHLHSGLVEVSTGVLDGQVVDMAAIRRDMEKYSNGLSRFMAPMGIKWSEVKADRLPNGEWFYKLPPLVHSMIDLMYQIKKGVEILRHGCPGPLVACTLDVSPKLSRLLDSDGLDYPTLRQDILAIPGIMAICHRQGLKNNESRLRVGPPKLATGLGLQSQTVESPDSDGPIIVES